MRLTTNNCRLLMALGLPTAHLLVQDLPTTPKVQSEKPTISKKSAVAAETPSLAETVPAVPKSPPVEKDKPAKERLLIAVSYGDKGLEFDGGDRFSLAMQHRLQFRYAYPFDADPRQLSDLDAKAHSFMVRRARFRMAGHAFTKWLKFNLQYDWAQPMLRDFWIDVARFSWLTLRAGRVKVIYNDERVASSGRQQMVNRSILNDVFTVDRQQGLQLMGRLFEYTAADLNYVLGVFGGRGVGERLNDDAAMMYVARVQWNTVGEPIDFSQSDYKFTPRWQLNIALAAATNKSNCTAFETDAISCRALTGYHTMNGGGVSVGSGKFQIDQAVLELRSVYKGLYFKHEAHVKRIIDHNPATNPWPRTAEMWGALVQLGYFPHAALDFIPAQLEIAGRCAWVDPNIALNGNDQYEYTAILNWFAHGHSNKLSFEVTQHVLAVPNGGFRSEQRYRSQWEFTF